MRPDVVEAVGKYAGLAGFAVGLVLIVFSRIVRLRLETVFSRAKAFQFYLVLLVLTWSLGVVGIGAWAFVNHNPGGLPGQANCSTQSGNVTVSGSGNVTQTVGGCADATINAPQK
jgi:hypothetical protein